MKKFLSVLLALSVAFTFTFGSCMSAFADDGSTHYSEANSKALLQAGYQAALADAAAYKVNYDNIEYTGTSFAAGTDITTFEISKDSFEAALLAAYEEALGTTVASGTSLEDDVVTTLEGDYDPANPTAASVDVLKVKNYLINEAKTTQAAVAEKASFAAYKTMLEGIVKSVDLSIYTETEKTATATDLVGYKNSKLAAQADINLALNYIKNATYGTFSSPSATVAYTTTYKGLYDAVMTILKVKENKDDAINTSLVTSLTYELKATYSTAKSEAAEEANEGVTKAAAKAALLKAKTTYENNNTLKADAQAQLDAYNEAMTYLIDNTTTYATTYAIVSVSKDGVDATNDSVANEVNYVALAEAAKAANANVATEKAYYTARGYNWDDAEAAKALTAQLIAIYGGDATAALNLTLVLSNDLTVGKKAELKAAVDYSEVVAKAETGYHGDVYAFLGEAYYEAEWTAVKAAIDTYTAAVDAAKVMDDVTAAQKTCETALKAIATADAIYSTISGTSIDTLQTYAGLALANAKAADSTITAIYVTFGDATDKVMTTGDLTAENIYLWYIAQGARTTKEAAALYGDACKVIDAYKTIKELKADAATVQGAITALPATPAIADKDAVVAAYDAYVALPTDAQNYVTNFAALTNAVKAVEKAEAYAVKAAITALPIAAKATVADKAAIEAARDAYDAYANTTAYALVSPKTLTAAGYDFVAALGYVKTDAYNAINAAYQALNNKYVADKLTAEDAAAVEALKAAIAAYIADYNESPATGIENTVAKIDAIVAAAVEAAKPAYTDTDAKAYILDMKVTAKATKVSKTKAKMAVTVNVTELKDNGYTVKYKYYVKAPGKKSYKLKKTSTKKSYTFTKLAKGKNSFKVKVMVYNADGKLVGSKTKTKTYTRK